MQCLIPSLVEGAYFWTNLLVIFLSTWIISLPLYESRRFHHLGLILIHLLSESYIVSEGSNCENTFLRLLLLS